MYIKSNPYSARIKDRFLLTAKGSTKKTYHIALDADLPYKVGDSVGVIPQNDPQEVAEIMQAIGSDSPELREHLTHKANLSRITTSFLKAHSLPTELLHTHNLLDILTLHPKKEINSSLLLPLMPRFYSIANSAKVFPNEIHLTVAYVEYTANNRLRRGVGSHYLCDMAHLHTTPIPIYVQPSNHFTLPEDPNASIIFVGPGTGVAPFRAFIQERIATQAMGRNWLFFGERHRATDFLYGPYFTELEKQERLRLDLAFSRDTSEKVYVQHKMYQERKSLWNWMENGAYFYVCGDASEMAKDVEAMLRTIAVEEGKMTLEEARLWIRSLRAQKRYLADVY